METNDCSPGAQSDEGEEWSVVEQGIRYTMKTTNIHVHITHATCVPDYYQKWAFRRPVHKAARPVFQTKKEMSCDTIDKRALLEKCN